ncbi:MAG: hypothetical protein JWM19_4140 [Actinomycetia bacterium]|nr:hypothetical protein [Actinomycetes bacterium]
MTHFSRLFKIVIDVPATDHDREVSFWAQALGQPLPQLDRAATYAAWRVACFAENPRRGKES